MQELLREGVGRASTSAALIAGIAAPVPREVDSATLLDGTSILSGSATAPVAVSRAAGIARLRDEAGRAVGLLAINTDTDGARTDIVDAAAVREWLAPLSANPDLPEGAQQAEVQWIDPTDPGAPLARADRGTPISFPLLIAALAVAVIELAMARWFSHAIVGPERAARSTAPPGAEGAPA
jgi:hypothetical protein